MSSVSAASCRLRCSAVSSTAGLPGSFPGLESVWFSGVVLDSVSFFGATLDNFPKAFFRGSLGDTLGIGLGAIARAATAVFFALQRDLVVVLPSSESLEDSSMYAYCVALRDCEVSKTTAGCALGVSDLIPGVLIDRLELGSKSRKNVTRRWMRGVSCLKVVSGENIISEYNT